MINYWQDSTSTTGTTTGEDYYGSTSATGTPSSLDYMWTATVTHATTYTRKLLVRMPKNWSKRDQDAFINLVNKETNTGWKIIMVVHGDVELVDHDIEVVSLRSFFDIVKSGSGATDKEKIVDFINNTEI